MSITKSRARAVADLAEGTILATVDIAAPPERVFRAITSKEVVEWWGEEGMYRTSEWTGDVRKGGRWRASGVGADGKAFAVEGEYLEVDPPRVVTHTWRPDWAPGPTTTVTYRLDPIDGGTRVTLRHTGFESREMCTSHSQGWPRVLGWLSAHVATAPASSYFFMRLVPPRPTFALDMNDEERRAMTEHVAYWTKHLEGGVAVAFGPVGDPSGPWGLGIVEVDDPAAVKELEANDPAIRANIGLRYEILPLLRAIVRPR